MRNEAFLRYGTHDRAPFTSGEAGVGGNRILDGQTPAVRREIAHRGPQSHSAFLATCYAYKSYEILSMWDLGLQLKWACYRMLDVRTLSSKPKEESSQYEREQQNVKAYRAKGIGILNLNMTPDDIMKVSVCSSVAHHDY